MDGGFLIAIGVGLLAFSGLGAWVAGVKGRGVAEGAVLGLLFGPLGVLVEALLPTPEPDEPRPRLAPVPDPQAGRQRPKPIDYQPDMAWLRGPGKDKNA